MIFVGGKLILPVNNLFNVVLVCCLYWLCKEVMETFADCVAFWGKFGETLDFLNRHIGTRNLSADDLEVLRNRSVEISSLLAFARPIVGEDLALIKRRLYDVCLQLKLFIQEIQEKCGADIIYEGEIINVEILDYDD